MFGTCRLLFVMEISSFAWLKSLSEKKNSTEVIITKDVAKMSYSSPSLTRDIIIRASRVSDAGGDDGKFENGLTHRVMVSEETELMSHQVNVWVKLRRTRPQSNN